MTTIVTITVNRWRIKSNAETGASEPVLCVNEYDGLLYGRKIGETRHYHAFAIPADAVNVQVKYDPENKTPCGASCWMQFEY